MQVFYEKGLKFTCQRCSHCCTQEPGFVYLSKEDLKRLLAWSRLCASDFMQKYCRWVQYYDTKKALCLKEKPNYDCIFWQNGGCICYNARPVQCSCYPFWSGLLKSKQDWDKNKKDCPGINKGKLYTKSQIQKNLFLYENNTPLTK